MTELPIFEILEALKDTLQHNTRAVLQAPPGAGKTTTVPLALLDQAWLEQKLIIMLEPRRLAARTAANRMATLLGEKTGETVGYQIKQERCFGSKTRILVVTEGILTRKLQSDPELSSAALVIFDEFHERSLHADLSLALCLQSQQILRDNLRILVMSATLNTDAISTLLNGAPIIQSDGFCYPVEHHYSKKSLKLSDSRQLLATLMNTAMHVINHHHASCLIFLPGTQLINRLEQSLNEYISTSNIDNIDIVPLYGNLDKQQQNTAIEPATPGRRKFVLATNIAETSLTIEGIHCVIDSGLERVLVYNPATGLNTLQTQFISQDSARQRSGRAGRLAAGHCYRLWTEQQHHRLVRHSSPEILHSDLSPLVLELANWGVQQADELQWLDLPPSGSIKYAHNLLNKLNAIDEAGKITTHGKKMLELGTHPRLAHMLLSATELNQAYHACLVASILSERDIFSAATNNSYDIHKRIMLLLQFKKDKKLSGKHINFRQCKHIIQTTKELHKRLKYTAGINLPDNTEMIDSDLTGVILAFAYPDRIARKRNQSDTRYLISNGKGAVIPDYYTNTHEDYLVIANLDARDGEARIHLAAEILLEDIKKYFPTLVSYTEILHWDETHKRVEARQLVSLGKIKLEDKKIGISDREAAQHLLLEAIQKEGLQCLNWSKKANELKQRIRFIHYQCCHSAENHNLTELPELPDFSDTSLSECLTDWLQPHLSNETSIEQCQKLDLYKILDSLLAWEQQQLIDKLAPEKIAVPSGSAIKIDYSNPEQPVLAVRLQEVFGLTETPAILNGHCKLMMHLLSPAHRPMQITMDLHSFWQTTYHDVKKELRGKYKKHFWPDDPLTAQATAKTKKG